MYIRVFHSIVEKIDFSLNVWSRPLNKPQHFCHCWVKYCGFFFWQFLRPFSNIEEPTGCWRCYSYLNVLSKCFNCFLHIDLYANIYFPSLTSYISMPRKVCFFLQDTSNSPNLFLCDIYESCDHVLTDMCNCIFVHIPLDGTLFAIYHFNCITLVIGIQLKTLIFQIILVYIVTQQGGIDTSI